MVHHCSSKHCPVWFRCQNVECEAVLDGKRGIGYRKHPAGLREHPAGPVKRVRMIRLGGVWLVRDAA